MYRAIIDRVRGRKARKMVQTGNAHLARGEREQALAFAETAIEEYERISDAYSLLSTVLMLGDDYLTILKKVHETLQPESYVEIGVDKGRSMKLIQPETQAVGIDPSPQIEPGNETSARIFKMFSDDFFESHNVLKELGTTRISMAFVDGSHIFEQTLRDIINIEKYSDDQTLMILHDCVPPGRIVAERKRITGFWCGDVWKLVDCLREYRPDLTINVIAARPSGLVFITGLDPSSTVLQDKYAEIEKKYIPRELGYHCLSGEIISGCLPSQWERVVECLPTYSAH